MLLASFAVFIGLVLLVWGADRFVVGAAATANNFGISPMIIGLTIVGFGTSAPELLVSAVAAWEGSPVMGVGNAIGSNITNVALVLGFAGLVAPLTVRSETLRREFPVLLATMLVAFAMLVDDELSRLNGILLLGGLGLMIYWVVNLGLREQRAGDPLASEFAEELPTGMSSTMSVFWIIVGLVVLLASSRLLVWGAVSIAEAFGVSELIIGLTIVALGTSLPELAATVMSALKREHDIAIGNVLGSNMFNLLGVLALPGVIAPTALPQEVMTRDFPVMVGVTVALFAMAYGFRKPGHIGRVKGALLLVAYLGYLGWLYVDIQA